MFYVLAGIGLLFLLSCYMVEKLVFKVLVVALRSFINFGIVESYEKMVWFGFGGFFCCYFGW